MYENLDLKELTEPTYLIKKIILLTLKTNHINFKNTLGPSTLLAPPTTSLLVHFYFSFNSTQ